MTEAVNEVNGDLHFSHIWDNQTSSNITDCFNVQMLVQSIWHINILQTLIADL